LLLMLFGILLDNGRVESPIVIRKLCESKLLRWARLNATLGDHLKFSHKSSIQSGNFCRVKQYPFVSPFCLLILFYDEASGRQQNRNPTTAMPDSNLDSLLLFHFFNMKFVGSSTDSLESITTSSINCREYHHGGDSTRGRVCRRGVS
jgi:hypothetical protein